jgi:tetratricopeptide (TPR) repeat protein
MTTVDIWRAAEQIYLTGRTLFEQGKFSDALAELAKAEDAFRKFDVRGHPFWHVLDNGLSGLAHTLYLKGQCLENLGDCAGALLCYETSLINKKFERSRPFKKFWRALRLQMTTCYEMRLNIGDTGRIADLLNPEDIKIDISYIFPFSLDVDRMPLARLYELDPGRYRQFRDFYVRAKERDGRLRRLSQASDVSSVKRLGLLVGGTMALLWITYGIVVYRALFLKR